MLMHEEPCGRGHGSPEGIWFPGRVPRTARAAQRGHLLVILMMGLAVMLIMMTAAAQSWTFQMRRERELELIFRGEQYVKALDAFRKASGGAFPIGDLKVLAQKNAGGIRFIRKLYPNPMDPNGEWQYLYLHPGGTGFINPCATLTGGKGRTGQEFVAGGAIPVSGFPMGGAAMGLPGMGGSQGGRGGKPRGLGGLDDDRAGGAGSMSELSAMDPNAFRRTGVAKMNLPIVGVVNCQSIESIRMYRGQTRLNNWAFTPLAMGEFAGNAQPGGQSGAAFMGGGLGLRGSEVYPTGRRGPGGAFTGAANEQPSWKRGKKQEPPPPPPEEEEDEDEEEDEEEDPNQSEDPNG